MYTFKTENIEKMTQTQGLLNQCSGSSSQVNPFGPGIFKLVSDPMIYSWVSARTHQFFTLSGPELKHDNSLVSGGEYG